MRMGAFGRALYTSPLRAAVQRRWVLPTMVRLGGRIDGACVVELGSGDGTGARLLRSAGAEQVVTVDLDDRMVGRISVVAPDAHPLRADNARLPLAHSVADVVVDFCGIHLADAWQDILSEAARVLRPGGRLCLEQPVNAAKRIPLLGRLGGFDEAALLAQVEAVGLRVLGVTHVGMTDLVAVAMKD